MNYYERHIGDYLKDTAHLSLLEHGIYGRLLDIYYSRESALPDDQIGRLVGARTKEETAALARVLAEFFTRMEAGWVQARCEAEIVRFQDKQRKAKASADARWSHTERNANASPNAMRTHSEGNPPTRTGARPSPDTSHQTPPTEAKLPRGRGSRLPSDWEPGNTGMAFAAKEGLTNGRVATELARFRDHWAAKAGADASKADWQAAWRNWVRKALDMAPAKPSDDPFAGAI